MKPPRKRVAFGLAVLAGAAFTLAVPLYEAATKRADWPSTAAQAAATATEMRTLVSGILVAGQIGTADLTAARERGIRTVVAMRPDGEEAAQPSAAAIGESARSGGLAFAYIPVPQGDMPDSVADDLSAALASAGDGPVLLYCRSGRRAARAWALAEASRTGGLSPREIEAALVGIGQPVDDLAERIRARAAARRS